MERQDNINENLRWRDENNISISVEDLINRMKEGLSKNYGSKVTEIANNLELEDKNDSGTIVNLRSHVGNPEEVLATFTFESIVGQYTYADYTLVQVSKFNENKLNLLYKMLDGYITELEDWLNLQGIEYFK